MSDIFIFVVCGAKEHIDTLHFSLKYLKKYSKNEIWVLTDNSRNEIPVNHDKIKDIKTPYNFDNHQASIYLKTGIHSFFPKGNRYCYLDTDIIALSENVDEIFNEYQSPITFAPDHCDMEQFSPYALNCGCLKENEQYLKLLNEKLDELDPYRTSNDKFVVESRREWQTLYARINKNLFSRIIFGLKYFLSWKKFHLSSEIYCDRKKNVWIKNNIIFMNRISLYKMYRLSKIVGLKWSFFYMTPITPRGKRLWDLKCDHLQHEILNKYGLKVNSSFQHWNGGVFLFDDKSHDFLDSWHQSTMEIFDDTNWKTRDQGTLIKTVWKLGLQSQPTLSKKWNLIADYHNPFLAWEGMSVRISEEEKYEPVLLHVYHHFGDENWSFWNLIFDKNK